MLKVTTCVYVCACVCDPNQKYCLWWYPKYRWNTFGISCLNTNNRRINPRSGVHGQSSSIRINNFFIWQVANTDTNIRQHHFQVYIQVLRLGHCVQGVRPLSGVRPFSHANYSASAIRMSSNSLLNWLAGASTTEAVLATFIGEDVGTAGPEPPITLTRQS